MLLHARKYLNTIDQIELTFLNGSEAASSSKRKQQALVVQLRGETCQLGRERRRRPGTAHSPASDASRERVPDRIEPELKVACRYLIFQL